MWPFTYHNDYTLWLDLAALQQSQQHPVQSHQTLLPPSSPLLLHLLFVMQRVWATWDYSSIGCIHQTNYAHIRQTMHTSDKLCTHLPLQYCSTLPLLLHRVPVTQHCMMQSEWLKLALLQLPSEWMKVLTCRLWIIINYSTNHLVYLVPLLFCDWGESPRAASLVPRCEHLNCSKLWGSCVWN